MSISAKKDFHYPTAVDWLRSEYLKRQQKNPAYSLRAFAKYLDLSHARLSQLLSNKRTITAGQAKKVAYRLLETAEERQSFMRLALDVVQPRLRKKSTHLATKTFTISDDVFAAIADSYHYAILSLTDTVGFKDDPKWVAKRLGISPIQVRDATHRLLRLGLLQKTGSHGLKATHQNLSSTEDLSSAALRRFHEQTLQRSIEALFKTPIEDREITSVTMAVDVKHLPEAKKIMRKMRSSISKLLEQGNKTEVYSFNMQLVPISIGGKK